MVLTNGSYYAERRARERARERMEADDEKRFGPRDAPTPPVQKARAVSVMARLETELVDKVKARIAKVCRDHGLNDPQATANTDMVRAALLAFADDSDANIHYWVEQSLLRSWPRLSTEERASYRGKPKKRKAKVKKGSSDV